MSQLRIMTTALVLSIAGATVAVLPASTASAADCVAPWQASAVYTGGMTASYNTHNWSAKWWTQNETPGAADVWADQGACGGSAPPPPSGGCNYPNWTAGTWYDTGAIVRYTNGLYYIAEHGNPGYDPTISTWYWDPYSCGANPPPPNPGGFIVSEAQFNQMFPGRNGFYTYQGLVAATSSYPAFATTGSDTVRRQEAAAFLANVSHETGGLVYVVEQSKGTYCDWSQPYGCPAGAGSYYGRGPMQLSWNFNYKAAGDALGLPLLTNPWLVENDAAIAWRTALWYWNTQSGPGTMTGHNAMVSGAGFGETIRSINGSLECNGGNPAQVQSRVNSYQQFVQILGTTPGTNLYC